MTLVPAPIIRRPPWMPPQEAYGRPSLNQMLQRIAKLWQTKQAEIEEQSADTMRQLQEATQAAGDRLYQALGLSSFAIWRKAGRQQSGW